MSIKEFNNLLITIATMLIGLFFCIVIGVIVYVKSGNKSYNNYYHEYTYQKTKNIKKLNNRQKTLMESKKYFNQ